MELRLQNAIEMIDAEDALVAPGMGIAIAGDLFKDLFQAGLITHFEDEVISRLFPGPLFKYRTTRWVYWDIWFDDYSFQFGGGRERVHA